jgi:hypothetical protein
MAGINSDDVDATRERMSMQEGGVCRFLGIRRVAARLGLIKKAKEGQGDFCMNGTDFTIVNNHSRCKEMLEMKAWPQPSSATEMADMMVKADASLRSLGGWAQMGASSSYIAPHVLRKIALLYQETCLPHMDWPDVPRDVWMLASPDQGNHLASIPQTWSSKALAQVVPSVPLIQWSMWTCLLDPPLQEPHAQQWLQSPSAPSQFASVAKELERRHGATPTPAEVITAALKRFRM